MIRGTELVRKMCLPVPPQIKKSGRGRRGGSPRGVLEKVDHAVNTQVEDRKIKEIKESVLTLLTKSQSVKPTNPGGNIVGKVGKLDRRGSKGSVLAHHIPVEGLGQVGGPYRPNGKSKAGLLAPPTSQLVEPASPATTRKLRGLTLHCLLPNVSPWEASGARSGSSGW